MPASPFTDILALTIGSLNLNEAVASNSDVNPPPSVSKFVRAPNTGANVTLNELNSEQDIDDIKPTILENVIDNIQFPLDPNDENDGDPFMDLQ